MSRQWWMIIIVSMLVATIAVSYQRIMHPTLGQVTPGGLCTTPECHNGCCVWSGSQNGPVCAPGQHPSCRCGAGGTACDAGFVCSNNTCVPENPCPCNSPGGVEAGPTGECPGAGNYCAGDRCHICTNNQACGGSPQAGQCGGTCPANQICTRFGIPGWPTDTWDYCACAPSCQSNADCAPDTDNNSCTSVRCVNNRCESYNVVGSCTGPSQCLTYRCNAGTCAEDTFKCALPTPYCDTAANKCVGCKTAADCSDNNGCTTDTCQVATGLCKHDGESCPSGATCKATPGSELGDRSCAYTCNELENENSQQEICGTNQIGDHPSPVTVCCAPGACRTAANGDNYCAIDTEDDDDNDDPCNPDYHPGCRLELCRGNIFVCDDGDQCTQDVCSHDGQCDSQPWVVQVEGCFEDGTGGGTSGTDSGTDAGTDAGTDSGTDSGTTSGNTSGSLGSNGSRTSSRRSSATSSRRNSSVSSRASSASAGSARISSARSSAGTLSSGASCTPAGRSCVDCKNRLVCATCQPGDAACLQSCKIFRFIPAYEDGTTCSLCTLQQIQNEPPACPPSSGGKSSGGGNTSNSSAATHSGTSSVRPGSTSSARSSAGQSSRRSSVSSAGSRNSSRRSGSSHSGSLSSMSGGSVSSGSSRSTSSFSSRPCSSSYSSDHRGSSRSSSSAFLLPCGSSSNVSSRSSAQSSRTSAASSRSSSAHSSRSSQRSDSSRSSIGVCRGDECTGGGSVFCAGFGMTCTTTDDLPCIRCIDGSSRSSTRSASSRSFSPSSRRTSSSSRTSSVSSRRSSGMDGGTTTGNDGGDDSGEGGSTSTVWYCGDGILTGNEECDDGNEVGGDGCTSRCRTERTSCLGNECTTGGNVVCGSFGQMCAPISALPCIQCVDDTNTPTDPSCNGNSCATGGSDICSQFGLTCSEDNSNPCFVCEAGDTSSAHSSYGNIAVMNCGGRECAQGGDNLCGAQGLTCVESGTLPCISCVNSLQNVVQPSCAVDGCSAGGNDVCGAQNLGCVPSKTGACFVCTNKEMTMVAVASPFICGNGTVEPGEECDQGALNSDNPNAYCRRNCRLGGCGDGILDTPLEICDDGNTRNGDGCSMLCTRERSAPVGTMPGQVIELPFLPGNGSAPGHTAGTLPSDVSPSSPVPASTPDTGPAAIAVMAAGAAAGYSWMRRRKK